MVGSFKSSLRATLLGVATLGAMVGAQPAAAQLFIVDPTFQNSPIEPNDPLVGLAIPGATQAEYRAHMLWNLRSGLNVAALQCQFSPYLRAVDNYNAFLAHHDRELAEAYTALGGYFTRTHGREGPRRFDDYSTITYNNFSTFQAQYAFCQTAARLAKEALALPKGSLYEFARTHLRELRGSLVPVATVIIPYMPHQLLRPTAQALTPPDCSVLRGRERRQCQRENR